MNKKASHYQYGWVVVLVFLFACRALSPTNLTIDATPTVDVTEIVKQAAGTALARMTQVSATQTQAALPPTTTPTQTPWPTITPRPTRTPGPTLPPLNLITVEGLRVAYIFDGNLYVQDSGKELVQLTSSGKDSEPIFSDDGKKIVFIRDLNVMCSIDADSSQEQALVTPELLASFSSRYDKFTRFMFLSFVPGTHQMLFNTHQFLSNTGEGSTPMRNDDLLLIDTDTGEIKQILLPGQARYFGVSPNGKWIWILAPKDELNVIDLDGKAIFHNLTTYYSMLPGTAVPDIFWSADSNILSIVPVTPPFPSMIEPKVLWQYSMKSGIGHALDLNPPLMGDMFSISPDGNWVVYTFFDPEERIKDAKPGIYLANLRDGTTQLLGNAGLDYLPSSYDWNPSSAHFIFENEPTDEMYLGNIQGEIVALNCRMFSGWIDDKRYLYSYRGLSLGMGEIDKEIKVPVIEFPPNTMFRNFQGWEQARVFVKPKPE